MVTEAPLAFASIDPIDLGKLTLVTPWMEEIVGVPHLDTVVVLLLFIGSSCAQCGLWLETLITFYNRANLFGKQVEVVLVGAHRSFSEFSSVVFSNINNPFLSVKFHSEQKTDLLQKFEIAYDSRGFFQPQLRIMEWLGARARTDQRNGFARVCTSIKTAFPFIQALSLEPMIRSVRNRSERLIAYTKADRQSVDPQFVYAHFTNDWRYAPVDRVQTMREHCNYIFSEVQDTLFYLSKSKKEQMDFLNLFASLASLRGSAEKRGVTANLIRYTSNQRLLELLEMANFDYFHSFMERLRMRSASLPFPKLSSTPPGDPRFLIKIYYRTREWTAIRETFPRDFEELKSLVAFKVPDVDLATARFFSDQLNPRLVIDADDENCPDGITEKYGTLNQMNRDEFESVISSIKKRHTDQMNMEKIRVLVIDGQTRIDDPSPAKNKQAALEQISAMIAAAKSNGVLTFSAIERLLSMATVLKLCDISENQFEALRRIPVMKLHFLAVTQVLTERMRRRSNLSPSAPASSDHLFSLGYSEALLQQLVAWFNDKFYTWIPSRLVCQASDQCLGSMEMLVTGLGKSKHAGASRRPSFLNDEILEDFVCDLCGGSFRLSRPIHDVSKLFKFSQGRCGEHAKAFALAGKALGFDVRLISGIFRPRHLPTEIYFGNPDLDHMWNEVFLKDRSKWVHVDVSASDEAELSSGALEIPKSARFDSPHAYDTSAGKLLSAVAASSDYVSVVTNRYLWSRESELFAKDSSEESFVKADVRALSAIIERFKVSESSGATPRRQSLIQHLISQDTLPPKGWADAADPQVGKGEEFEGPSGIRIRIVGGEIPQYMQRRKNTMFSSYSKLRGLDGSRWRVCAVEVTKEPKNLLVSRIRFGYCMGDEDTPSMTSSTEAVDGWFFDEEPFVALASPLRTVTEIDAQDHVASVDLQYSEEGLLREFEPRLFSNVSPHMKQILQPVVGFYGSHKRGEGIDFVGLYLATSVSGVLSPLIGFN